MRGLFDYEYQLESINKHQPPLQKLDRVIDWELFRAPIEETFRIEAKGPGGRPPFDRLMMFKILILQRYYNLSDEQTEFHVAKRNSAGTRTIKDRLSFQQFLGLRIGDKVPDEKTVWAFKEQLKEKGLSEKLFGLFTQTLISNGIIAKEGSIVDASFVNVPRPRNSREENDAIKKIAEADRTSECVIYAEYDFEANAKQRDYWALFADRRPEAYGAICASGYNA